MASSSTVKEKTIQLGGKGSVSPKEKNKLENRENDQSTAGLKFMIMNTGAKSSKNKGDKPTERRKQAIFDVITSVQANLVLLQEFNWVGIRSKVWNGFVWPDNVEYTGHVDASIIYDVNEVLISEFRQSLLDDTLKELIRIGKIPQGFSPFPRMCIRKITTKGVPDIECICISWHGRHNKATLDDLKEEFRNILDFVLKLSEKKTLPVIIAGDFNVKIKDINKFVPSSLVLHTYTPTKRRDEDSIIDFFISSKSLVFSDMKAIDLKTESKVDGVLSLLDHDPVVSLMTKKVV